MQPFLSDIIDILNETFDNNNFKGFKICTVKTTNPFVFLYEDIEIGASLGDTVYVHPLTISSLISLDEAKLSEIQNFKSSTAYNSPNFEAAVEGSIPDFIKEFYLFYKNWQQNYILNPGDLISVYELKENSFLVIGKIKLDLYVKEGGN